MKTIKTHTVCGTKLKIRYGSLGRAYHSWICPKCRKVVPEPEIRDTEEQKRGDGK